VRIAIDCRKLRDFGIGTYLQNLLQHLVRIDTRNEYVLMCFERDAERLQNLGSVLMVSSGLYSISELVSLGRVVASARADLFHEPHYVLPYGISCPAVVTVHDIIHVLFPDYLPGTLARLYARHFMRRALSASAAVITVSDASRADIVARYPWAADSVIRVHNGIDESFHDRVEPETRERPYFLAVGNNKPHKNFPMLIRAYEVFHTEAPEHELLIVGPGEDSLPSPPAGVHLLSSVPSERLARLYRGCTALLFPSLYEGFGLPAVEAQACGAPVIASDIPVFRETLGESALFFPLEEPAFLAAVMAKVAQDDGLRRELSAKGLRNSRRFSFETCARETLAVYERVRLKSGGRS